MTPGTYVRLAVADTGVGMEPEVAVRAFEPFFTTKSSGVGSGLGLATVYGIVTAAGGTVRIYSEPGVGTSVKVYLPSTTQADRTVVVPSETPPSRPAGGRRRLLLVEDEPAVRDFARRLLVGAGYDVVVAGNGPEALDVLAGSDDGFDVMLTDVVMPGMSGRELAEQAREQHPGMCVVYMSGYTGGLLGSQLALDPSEQLIEKPFTRAVLIQGIEEARRARARARARTRAGGPR
jgi:CheY-like chemotaxis protein